MIPPETWSWLFQKGGCSTQLCKDHTEPWKGSMSIINQPVHLMKCKGFKNCRSAFFQYISSPLQSTSLPSSSSSEPSTDHWVGCKQRQYMVRGSPCMDDLRPCRIGMQTSQDGFHLMHLNLEQQEVISIPPSWWRLSVEAISLFRERLNWCIYSVKSDQMWAAWQTDLKHKLQVSKYMSNQWLNEPTWPNDKPLACTQHSLCKDLALHWLTERG